MCFRNSILRHFLYLYNYAYRSIAVSCSSYDAQHIEKRMYHQTIHTMVVEYIESHSIAPEVSYTQESMYVPHIVSYWILVDLYIYLHYIVPLLFGSSCLFDVPDIVLLIDVPVDKRMAYSNILLSYTPAFFEYLN